MLEGSAQEKKCRFTLDYVEQKIGRKLEGKEEEEMKTLIQKGDERAIYAFLFGSGTNQCWQCQICPLVIKGTMKEVAKHYSNEHQADPLYPCQLCGKVIKSTHTFKRHRTYVFSPNLKQSQVISRSASTLFSVPISLNTSALPVTKSSR